jgi:integrase
MFIVKRKKSPYWVCCYRHPDGRWLKKSTKQTDRTKALQFCVRIQESADQARAGVLTESKAREIIGAILEHTTGQAMQQWTVRSWVAHWLDIKEKSASPKTMAKYRQVLRDFEKSLGSRANLPLVHVTSADALRYRNAILEAGRGDMTANQSMKVVGAAFNAAVKQDHISRNPCGALDSLAAKARRAATKRATFTPTQVAKLAGAADGDWRAAILFGYYTGARLSDVANMRWEAIDLDKNEITFTASKTGKEITLPLHADLRRVLLRLPRGIAKAPLFSSLAGRGTGGAHGLSGRFAAIMERAGIERKMMSVVKGGREIADLSFHSLRHSFTSALANANVAEEIRMKLTGHSTREVHAGYTQHEMALLRAAIDPLPKISAK